MKRYCLFPIQHPELFALYKQAEASFWSADAIDLAKDKADWNDKMTDRERTFVEHILAFFAVSEGVVMENIATNFYDEVELPEARHFYAFQIAMEAVHSETYSLLIDTLITDPDRRLALFDAAERFPTIAAKTKWSMQYLHRDQPLATRIVAFAITEGIFFSGSFASFFWLAQKGLTHGLKQANQYISRDEGLHMQFACVLYKTYIQDKLAVEAVHEMVAAAVQIEAAFFAEALKVEVIGMSHVQMTQYICYVADVLIRMLGYDAPLYGKENPFGFMDNISLSSKDNFFERRNTEYSMAAQTTQSLTFVTDVEF